MAEPEFKLDDSVTDRDLLYRIAQELKSLRELVSKSGFAEHTAESEIPERMRRFANYYHDIVHIKGEYISIGIPSPKHIDQEMERCHDRFRQLLAEAHTDGNAFEKVRREMAVDPDNRYDHTRQLSPPKESK